MISVNAALELLEDYRPDLAAERVPLSLATDRILQSDIVSTFTQPPAATSVMDGYAFRQGDISRRMTVVGESRAGRPYKGAVNKGEAVRIFTGAHLPKGTDHIEIQEYAVRDGDDLKFIKTSKGRTYIRPPGSLFKRGDVLFEAGQRITPAVVSAIASANISSVSVKRKPTIAIFRCGDELRPVGSTLHEDQIIDSNGPYLSSLLLKWGFEITDLGLVADDPSAIKGIITQCDTDFIIPVGGASVGDYDYLKSVFLDAGFKPVFETVAVKPGKPVWLSHKSGQVVLGLPGNPSSVFTCSHIFLSQLLGRSARWNKYTLTADVAVNGVREKYIPAMLDENNGVTPLASRTAQLRSLANADVLIRRKPFADELLAGDQVDCLRLNY